MAGPQDEGNEADEHSAVADRPTIQSASNGPPASHVNHDLKEESVNVGSNGEEAQSELKRKAETSLEVEDDIDLIEDVASIHEEAAPTRHKRRRRTKKPKIEPNLENGSDDGDNDVIVSAKAKTTWLDAAEEVLRREGYGKMLHLKTIQQRIIDLGLMDSSNKASLEALLYRETARGRDRFIRADGLPGFFGLPSLEEITERKRVEQLELAERSKKQAAVAEKYDSLKRRVRQVIYENVALSDELRYFGDHLARLHAEKRNILKRLTLYESRACDGDDYGDDDDIEREDFISESEPEIILPEILRSETPLPRAAPSAAGARARARVEVPDTWSSPTVPAASSAGRGRLPKEGKQRRNKMAAAHEPPLTFDESGQPILPFTAGGVTVKCLGEVIVDRPSFHKDKYIWPVGYVALRTFTSYLNPESKSVYICSVHDGGNDGPVFEIKSEDDPDNPIRNISATASHAALLRRIKMARTGREDYKLTASGPTFFGLNHPSVMLAISKLPKADFITKQLALNEKQEEGGPPGIFCVETVAFAESQIEGHIGNSLIIDPHILLDRLKSNIEVVSAPTSTPAAVSDNDSNVSKESSLPVSDVQREILNAKRRERDRIRRQEKKRAAAESPSPSPVLRAGDLESISKKEADNTDAGASVALSDEELPYEHPHKARHVSGGRRFVVKLAGTDNELFRKLDYDNAYIAHPVHDSGAGFANQDHRGAAPPQSLSKHATKNEQLTEGHEDSEAHRSNHGQPASTGPNSRKRSRSAPHIEVDVEGDEDEHSSETEVQPLPKKRIKLQSSRKG